jgi:hypothetical protein
VIASLLLFMKGHWRSITPACTDLHQGKARAQAGLITGFCRQVLTTFLRYRSKRKRLMTILAWTTRPMQSEMSKNEVHGAQFGTAGWLCNLGSKQ